MASVIKELELQVAAHPDKLLYAFLDIDGDIAESVTYTQFFQRTLCPETQEPYTT